MESVSRKWRWRHRRSLLRPKRENTNTFQAPFDCVYIVVCVSHSLTKGMRQENPSVKTVLSRDLIVTHVVYWEIRNCDHQQSIHRTTDWFTQKGKESKESPIFLTLYTAFDLWWSRPKSMRKKGIQGEIRRGRETSWMQGNCWGKEQFLEYSCSWICQEGGCSF